MGCLFPVLTVFIVVISPFVELQPKDKGNTVKSRYKTPGYIFGCDIDVFIHPYTFYLPGLVQLRWLCCCQNATRLPPVELSGTYIG